MSEQRSSWGRMIVGLVVIAIGIMLLVANTNPDKNLVSWGWVIVTALSCAGFIGVAIVAKESWGWTPAYIFGAIAIVILLSQIVKVTEQLIPVLVMTAISLPFIVAWTRKRQEWGLLIPPYVLLSIIPLILLSDADQTVEKYAPAYVLAVIGLPFLVSYFIKRTLPPLIVAGILFLIALIFFFSTSTMMAEQILTLLVPTVLVGIGIILLAQTWLNERRQQP
ncbi:MAG: hypothetical protein K8I60_13855 [Anaerolineae bacterium]|nr:hypothetical protein [Anaerolineae bacterium]